VRILGEITSVVVVVVVLGAIVIGARSIPDAKRYLRMRSM